MSPQHRPAFVFLLASVGIAIAPAATVYGELISNGDFETGSLNGWTVFVTQPNGTNGLSLPLPDVVLFDTTNAGTVSNSARFSVGRLGSPTGYQGGGIYQNVNVTAAGDYRLQADIAAISPLGNAEAGLYELLFDGVTVASQSWADVGSVPLYGHLTGDLSALATGSHEVRLQIRRSSVAVGGTNYLFQYADNVSLAPVPEPSGIALLGIGAISMLAYACRRWKRARYLA